MSRYDYYDDDEYIDEMHSFLNNKEYENMELYIVEMVMLAEGTDENRHKDIIERLLTEFRGAEYDDVRQAAALRAKNDITLLGLMLDDRLPIIKFHGLKYLPEANINMLEDIEFNENDQDHWSLILDDSILKKLEIASSLFRDNKSLSDFVDFIHLVRIL